MEQNTKSRKFPSVNRNLIFDKHGISEENRRFGWKCYVNESQKNMANIQEKNVKSLVKKYIFKLPDISH